MNHTISRRLVETAAKLGQALAIEDLTGIRERGNGFNREMRFELGNWSFYQLKQYLTYKAAKAGIPVVSVEARNTSRTCSVCGYCDKQNRKSQSKFECLECGFSCNADMNASVNIAAKAEGTHQVHACVYGGNVTCPMDGTLALASLLSKPLPLGSG